MGDTLTKADMLIIRQVHSAFEAYGIPFLPAPKWAKRAKALADRGLLTAHDSGAVPASEWCLHSFTPTQAGIAAYNAQVSGASNA